MDSDQVVIEPDDKPPHLAAAMPELGSHGVRCAVWSRMRILLFTMAVTLALLATLCWFMGTTEILYPVQASCLLAAILALNFTPFLAELACRRLDPLDAKHPFLAYFFLIFTLHSVYATMFDGIVNPALLTPEPSTSLRIRALSAILLSLSGFVAGCYCPFGRYMAAILPKHSSVSPIKLKLVAFSGLLLGSAAFYTLMTQAGGVASFLKNLGTWRTTGVIEGVGYLTFPISVIMPAAALLLLLYALPPPGRRFTWKALGTVLLALGTLGPIIVLGFRASVLPALLQFVMAWHYFRRRFSIGFLFFLGSTLLVLLTFYALARNARTDDHRSDYLNAVLFRVPGLDFVERVVWRLDLGEPHRGVEPVFKEAATIFVPRAIWKNKPEAGSLAFADIFFFDVFLGRGDPIDGIRSGVSPTLIGETLWIGGLPAVLLAGLALGILARVFAEWRQHGGRNIMNVFIYALYTSFFPVFVEAPQNALNGFCLVGLLGVTVYVAICRRPARATPPPVEQA